MQTSIFDESDQKPARRTRAPEELNPLQRKRLDAWAERKVPWISRGAFESLTPIDDYIEETLGYWQANGRLKADWTATVQNRIREVEHRKLRAMARAGREEAKQALLDPVAWASRYDSLAAMKPTPTATDPAPYVRPQGGRVIHLRRA